MKHLLRIALLAIPAILVPCVGAATASAQDLIPTLECEIYDVNTNTQIAEFGYASTFTTTVHIDVGPNNFFSPGVLFRNQPTDYLPGVQNDVFATSWQVSASLPQLSWFLNGESVVAKGMVNVPGCGNGSTNTILNGSGPPANTLGNDGDFFIDTTGEVLYGPKAAGVWPTPGVPLVGPQGEPGQNGANGTPGTNGNTILSGAGAPSDTLGSDGDFYIDTAAHVLYGPKAGGHWPASGFSLVGPTGSTGATGATGSQGPQGPAGMPVCRNTPATILACGALFVPGTWTVGPRLHAADVLSRGHTVYARGSGTVTRSGRLALRLHKLRVLKPGRYTLTIRLVGHGFHATLQRPVAVH